MDLILKEKRKEKNEKEKIKGMLLNKEYIWLRKKGFFKSFAKQTDTFTVLNFTTKRVEKPKLRIFEN